MVVRQQLRFAKLIGIISGRYLEIYKIFNDACNSHDKESKKEIINKYNKELEDIYKVLSIHKI